MVNAPDHGFAYTDLEAEKPPCNCGHSTQDISTEQLKLITDRMDAQTEALNNIYSSLYWLCNTFSSLLTSIPNPIVKAMVRKAMNEGQHHADG